MFPYQFHEQGLGEDGLPDWHNHAEAGDEDVGENINISDEEWLVEDPLDYEDSWIPYPSPEFVSNPYITNQQQMILASTSPMPFPAPSDLNHHYCLLHPQECAGRRHALQTRNTSVTTRNTTDGIGAKTKTLMSNMDLSGFGVALLVALLIILGLHVGWDRENTLGDKDKSVVADKTKKQKKAEKELGKAREGLKQARADEKAVNAEAAKRALENGKDPAEVSLTAEQKKAEEKRKKAEKEVAEKKKQLEKANAEAEEKARELEAKKLLSGDKNEVVQTETTTGGQSGSVGGKGTQTTNRDDVDTKKNQTDPKRTAGSTNTSRDDKSGTGSGSASGPIAPATVGIIPDNTPLLPSQISTSRNERSPDRDRGSEKDGRETKGQGPTSGNKIDDIASSKRSGPVPSTSRQSEKDAAAMAAAKAAEEERKRKSAADRVRTAEKDLDKAEKSEEYANAKAIKEYKDSHGGKAPVAVPETSAVKAARDERVRKERDLKKAQHAEDDAFGRPRRADTPGENSGDRKRRENEEKKAQKEVDAKVKQREREEERARKEADAERKRREAEDKKAKARLEREAGIQDEERRAAEANARKDVKKKSEPALQEQSDAKKDLGKAEAKLNRAKNAEKKEKDRAMEEARRLGVDPATYETEALKQAKQNRRDAQAEYDQATGRSKQADVQADRATRDPGDLRRGSGGSGIDDDDSGLLGKYALPILLLLPVLALLGGRGGVGVVAPSGPAVISNPTSPAPAWGINSVPAHTAVPVSTGMRGPANHARAGGLLFGAILAGLPLVADWHRDYPKNVNERLDCHQSMMQWMGAVVVGFILLAVGNRQSGFSVSHGRSIAGAVSGTIAASGNVVWGAEDMVFGNGRGLIGAVLAVGVGGWVMMRGDEDEDGRKRTDFTPTSKEGMYMVGALLLGLVLLGG